MSTDGNDLDDRHVYVTRDGRFEYRRLAVPSPSALVIRFHAPLDSILRRLDAAYLTSAWESARSILETHDIDSTGLWWGVGHEGLAYGVAHQHPPRPLMETIGWIGTAATLGEFAFDDPNTLELLPRWMSIAHALETSDPPMCLMYDHYRAQRITRRGGAPIANDDVDAALEFMRVDCSDSPVEWNVIPPPTQTRALSTDEAQRFVARLREEGGLPWFLKALSDEHAAESLTRSRGRTESLEPDDAPWVRLRDAMAANDHVAVVDAMDAVRSEYSEHGARICLESAARWLMVRPTPDS
jgi:hypothetical protein